MSANYGKAITILKQKLDNMSLIYRHMELLLNLMLSCNHSRWEGISSDEQTHNCLLVTHDIMTSRMEWVMLGCD